MIPELSFSQGIDWQGHRGARGLMPENSIPAFRKAMELGVTTLEMDVVITRDKQVIVSHDPWISGEFCLDSSGNNIPAEDERKYNIYRLTYDEILKFDCGSKGNTSFPRQEKIAVCKPLLTDVFRMAEKYCKDYNRNEIYYNIEIKSEPQWDDLFHPVVGEFCDLVYQVINDYIPLRRVIIQSFDPRALNYLHNKHPGLNLAYLVEHEADPAAAMKLLDFSPSVYSPNFELLSPEKIKWLHSKGMRVIPWTVNQPEAIKNLIIMGVNGIITDYPDLITAWPGREEN
ncbi:MAG TPA: glycerophosphodiester phosphodiesterase [Cyclobacteriaceae bacterium]|nr:glycerophosphodiester phosphodiesterase [Cyclobacteriaceae bacterium]